MQAFRENVKRNRRKNGMRRSHSKEVAGQNIQGWAAYTARVLRIIWEGINTILRAQKPGARKRVEG